MSRSLQFAHATELKEAATARRAGEEKLAKELKDRSAEAAAATARAEAMAMERAALAEQAKGAVEHAATLVCTCSGRKGLQLSSPLACHWLSQLS